MVTIIRAALLALLVLGGGCVNLSDFKGNNFNCHDNGNGGNGPNDDEESCPSGYWCHAKGPVTSGNEGGNICVPQGEHWCNGSRCPDGQRCSSTNTSGDPKCVACNSPCSPILSSGGGNGGGGGGGSGGNDPLACDSSSCPNMETCIGGQCGRACTDASPSCTSCRFTATVTDTNAHGGGVCIGFGIVDPCTSSNCPSGQSCTYLLQGDAGSLRCTGGGAGPLGACRWGRDCSSGICVTGFCRDTCLSNTPPRCPDCRKMLPDGGTSPVGYCQN